MYTVTLEVNDGEKYTSKGKTMDDAFIGLVVDYTKVKTKGTITLENGKKKSSKFFYLRPLRRIVVNKLKRLQVGRDLEFLLK